MKINVNNKVQLAVAIREAEGRAHVRTITPEQISEALDRVQKHLGIAKAALHGVVVSADLNAQHFPRSYNGTPASTQFVAIYSSSSSTWYVTDIHRSSCRTGVSKGIQIQLTEKARAAVLRRAEALDV